jgi:uncharacterized protein HemX
MKAFAVALVVIAALATVGAVPGFATTSVTAEHTISRTVSRDDVEPCRDGKPPAPGERCRGPVKDESGGGGTALTIAVSVVVGLGIATAAFIVLRRQLATHHPADGATPPPTTGEQP